MGSGQRWRVAVDAQRCVGTANCIDRAPELFELTDQGVSQPRVDIVTTAAQHGLAAEAADVCPAQAIHVDLLDEDEPRTDLRERQTGGADEN
ncbi:ferredoxin [Mycolicibacterium sp. XJ1819]